MRTVGRVARWFAPVLVAVVAASACTGEDASRGSWNRLPDLPLAPRADAVVAEVDGRLVVTGGWHFLCPPGADCVTPEEPPYSDGAAYDFGSGRWSPIADAPHGFVAGVSAVVEGDLYVLGRCEAGVMGCSPPGTVLRYRSADDAWDVLPAPPSDDWFLLVAHGDTVVAYTGADVGGGNDDYLLVPGQDRWEPIPDDPLPSIYDRRVVSHGGDLWLFGSVAGSEASNKVGARFDATTGAWEELPDSGTSGYEVWAVGDRFYLDPHFGIRPGVPPLVRGGVFDPAVGAWSALPVAVDDSTPLNPTVGVIGETEAAYESASGWVLDARGGSWLTIPARPGEASPWSGAVGTVGNRLVVVGGEVWDTEHREGELLDDVWMWTPPPD